jgi:hypothetical protein
MATSVESQHFVCSCEAAAGKRGSDPTPGQSTVDADAEEQRCTQCVRLLPYLLGKREPLFSNEIQTIQTVAATTGDLSAKHPAASATPAESQCYVYGCEPAAGGAAGAGDGQRSCTWPIKPGC